jgi:ATP-dependent helicase/nuclease subunit B
LYQKLFSSFCTNDVIIAVNNRLAIYISEEYFKFLSNNNPSFVTPTPRIYTFDNYINTIWDPTANQITLSSLQQQLSWQSIWYEIIKDNNELSATLSLKAYLLCQQYIVSEQELRLHSISDEQQIFFQAYNKYRDLCTKNSWVNNNDIMLSVAANITELKNKLPNKIYLVGFDTYTPLQENFINSISNFSAIEYYQNDKANVNTRELYAAIETKDEIKTMCSWAMQKSAEGKNIACIVPSLHNEHHHINDYFTNELAIETIFNLDPQHSWFNISAGVSLASVGIIECALKIFALATVEFNLDNISYLLNSPYIYENLADMIKLMELDNIIYNYGCPEPTLSFINAVMQNQEESSRLKWCAFFKLIDVELKSKNIAAWIKYFKTLLETIQWSMHREHTSSEYQALQSFNNALAELQRCDILNLSFTPQAAYRQIYNYINSIVFKPEGHDSKIQILGTLEASTMHFDAAWIMGMSKQQWPQFGDTNPFIPLNIQKKLQMPHSSVEKDVTYANKQMQHLKHIAGEIVFSYPQELEHYKTQATATISELAVYTPASTTTITNNAMQLETIIDNYTKPIENNTKIKGGSNLFKLFTECPFKAFAKLRLNAYSYNPPKHGISGSDKGNIVHHTLESIWRELRTQGKLLALNDEQIADLINQHLEKIINNTFHNHPYDRQHKIIALEQERIFSIIHNWLQYEKTRSNFKVISCEEKWQLTVSDLHLQIKIDRVDQRADGSKVIIDYKTGDANPTNWLSSPIRDPQLPLYSVYTNDHAAIAFAHLKQNSITLKGISNNEKDSELTYFANLNKKSPNNSWEELQQDWQQQLGKTAYEFKQGDATVKPLDTKSCTFCDLKSLCRIKQWQHH